MAACRRISESYIMCDTTSINTGKLKGICKQMQTRYDENVLTIMCRHHILERFVTKVYEIALDDNSQSPNIQLFEKFMSEWNSFDASNFRSCANDAKVKRAVSSNEKKGIIEFALNQLAMQKEPRKDYIGFLELVLLFLGKKDYTNAANKKVTIKVRQPGALHRARFMARVIYCLKMTLFRPIYTPYKTKLHEC